MQKNPVLRLLGVYLMVECWFTFALSTEYSGSLTPEEQYIQRKQNQDLLFSSWLKLPVKETLNVIAVIGNGLDMFDFAQLTTMISMIPNTVIKTVAATKDPIITQEGTKIVPDYSYEDEFDVDVLSFVAGTGPNPETSAFAKKIQPKVKKFIFTICQGAEAIADSGILDGHNATVTKLLFSKVKRTYPKVNWIKKARFVEDGKFITTSGGAAGLDGVFTMIARLYDEETAWKVAGMNEHRWDPNPDNDGFENFVDKFPFPKSMEKFKNISHF